MLKLIRKWKEYTPVVLETEQRADIKAFEGDASSGMSFETRIKKIN